MSDIDKMLEQAESLQSEGEWEIISKYRRNDTYVDDDGAVNIAGRRIDAIRENISVQGENHSQYIEFIMDRYYDGIDLTEQTLAIHYEVGDVSDEDAPINVYKNDTQIKFGWVVENTLTQYEATIEFCIWARGTLPDGNAYVLKTLPQKYEVKRGLEIAGGIIEPSTNWYTQFALNMDQKVSQATESADRAEQAASSLDGVVETVTTARDEVVQKASTVNTQHSEVESWHQEAEQFRNEAEQFRNQAEAITGIGLAEEGKPGIVQPDGVTTKVDENGKLIVIGGGSGGGGTTDYQALENKPSIAGIELSGDKSYDELGLASKATVERNFEIVNQNFQTLGEFTQQLDQDVSALDTELEQTNQQLQSTTDKVDNLTGRTESGFKVEVVGKDIHLTDAVDGKLVEFAMYGKSEQKQYSGKNLLKNTATSKTINGITFTVNKDGSVTANGTSTAQVTLQLKVFSTEEIGKLNGYKLSGGTSSCRLFIESNTTFQIYGQSAGNEGVINVTTEEAVTVFYRISKDKTVNETFYPMISLEGGEYEPYTGGIPSPNPNYPQEIETAGASGSIEVKSCGKNLVDFNKLNLSNLNIGYGSNPLRGITRTVNESKQSITFNGTTTESNAFGYLIRNDEEILSLLKSRGKVKFTLIELGGNTTSNVNLQFWSEETSHSSLSKELVIDFSDITINNWNLVFRTDVNTVLTNYEVSVMITLENEKVDTYEPYKESKATIPTPNGLSGIKVSSGGNYTDENGQQWITDEIIRYADGSGEYIEKIKHYSLAVADMNNTENLPGWKNAEELDDLNKVVGENKNRGYSVLCNIGTRVGVNTTGQKTIFLAENIENITQSEFKTTYSNLVVDIYIPRITPIRTPLTAEQLSEIDKLNTFKPITNVSNNEQCGMKITYATLQEALMLQEALNGSKANAEEIVDIKKELSDTTFKVNTIIEKADLGIKETATGEEIHLIDSAEGKAVEFALYGKARQNTTTGKNLLKNIYTSTQIKGGLTFVINENGSVTVNGTSTEVVRLTFLNTREKAFENGNYIISGCPNSGSSKTYCMEVYTEKLDGTNGVSTKQAGNELEFYYDDTNKIIVQILVYSGVTLENVTFYPMVRLASIEDDTYEPYTNGASPNPDYPQEIELSGESYNLLEHKVTSQTINGGTITVNEDKSITANGTFNANTTIFLHNYETDENMPSGSYILSGCPSGGSNSTFDMFILKRNTDNTAWGDAHEDYGSGTGPFDYDGILKYNIVLRIRSGYVANNLTFYPMIRKASVKNDRYMPYGKGSVEVKSVGKNLIPYPYYNTTTTKNGIDYTVDNGKIIADGTATAYSEFLVRSRTETNSPLILKEGTYTLRGCPKGGDQYTYHISVGKSSVDNKWELIGRDCGDGFIFTIDKETQVGISCAVSSGKTVDNIVFKPMLYNATEESIGIIPTPNGLAGIKVSSGGNYTDSNGQQWICDEIVKYADGSGKKIHRTKKIVLNGSENWSLAGSIGANGFYSDNAISDGVTNVSPMLCDMFTTSLEGNANMKDNQIKHGASAGNTASFLYLKTSKAETVEELKAFLSENNVTCYYILATPIETPLTAEELAEISTFYPVTNISNDFDCGMKVKYNCDSKNYIDNKLAQIAAAVVNNI